MASLADLMNEELNNNEEQQITETPKRRKRQKVEKVESLKEISYELSFLARLDEDSPLREAIKKQRNPEKRGGKTLEIIYQNKTDIIIRREYSTKSKLLVVIPEKGIYRIYDELKGIDLTQEESFSSLLSNFLDVDNLRDIYEQITEGKRFYQDGVLINEIPKMVYRLFSVRSGDRWSSSSGRWKSYISYSTTSSDLLYSPHSRIEHFAVLSKSKKFLENPQPEIIQEINNSGHLYNTAQVKLLIEKPQMAELIKGSRDIPGISDINVLRNLEQLRTQLNREIQGNTYYSIWNYKLTWLFYSYQLQINSFKDYVQYLRQVEEYDLLSSSDRLTHYFDLLKQQKELNNGKIRDKYFKLYLTYENKVQALYRRHAEFIKTQKQFSYSAQVEKLEHITSKDTKEYDFIMKLPRTYGDLIEEGSNMKNCVASYSDRVYDGETIIFLIRRKKSPEKSYVTLEMKQSGETFKLVQCKGIQNTTPPMDAINYIYQLLDLQTYKNCEVTSYDLIGKKEQAAQAVKEEKERLAKEQAEQKKNQQQTPDQTLQGEMNNETTQENQIA